MKKSNDSKLPQRLKWLLKENGMKQIELARRIGVNKQAIHTYTVGKRAPNVDIMNRICDYFGVTMDYLTGRSDEKN